MKFCFYVEYDDGSNPYFNVWGSPLSDIKKELRFQILRNGMNICNLQLWIQGKRTENIITWHRSTWDFRVWRGNDPAGRYKTLGNAIRKLERLCA